VTRGDTSLKVRRVIASIGLAMFPFIFSVLHAQTASNVPVAPLPSQIASAKKVFISNARGEWNPYYWSGTPERTYNEFYAAIKTWGHYELVAAPGDADLVLQISFSDSLDVNATGGQVSKPVFRLVILDPKTHILLWTLDEHLSMEGNQKKRDSGFDSGINNLVGYLKAITVPTAAPTN
jgi:hypothetical protein